MAGSGRELTADFLAAQRTDEAGGLRTDPARTPKSGISGGSGARQ